MTEHSRHCFAGRNRGFTLVELMVSMVLGLVIIGGATGVILANRQSYRTNEGLSQLQESARSAFELMARDIRQAGVTGCDSNGRVANVVRAPDAGGSEAWWQPWFGMQGFAPDAPDGAVVFGTGAKERVEDTESLLVQGLDGNSFAIASHVAADGIFRLNTASSVAVDDIMMVCNFDHAAIFKVTGYDAEDLEVSYTSSPTGSPRNCSQGLGYPTSCGSPGNAYGYLPSAQMARLMAVDWFVGNNGRGDGRSLFRKRMDIAPEEMVAGVSNMSLRYLQAGGSGFIETVTNWANVTAVEVTLTIDSADARISSDPGVNQGRLQREFTNVITLRNRVL